MPILHSGYTAPWWMLHPHASTIVPSAFRDITIPYKRERYELSDGDFVDLDWVRQGSSKLVILSHGLEGNSTRGYVTGTARNFIDNGWDVLAWNCRSCGGEINRLPRMYHHADTSDIAEVIEHVQYSEILLVGYSMGGSISLNYLGSGKAIPDRVVGAVVFSVPVVMKSSVDALSSPGNSFYRKRFLRKLSVKMKLKAALYPELINVEGIDDIKYFEDFDNRFTAPLHGFRDADHFYSEGSALGKLASITRPVLIVNAINDPFLGSECYPVAECMELQNVFLETPRTGGHVGFVLNRKLDSYMDHRPISFYDNHIRQ